jgi:hypothetical protein
LEIAPRRSLFGWLRRRTRSRSPFAFQERDWRRAWWYRWLNALPALTVGLIVVLLAGVVGIVMATGAASTLVSQLPAAPAVSTPGSSGLVVQQAPGQGTPTPDAAQYLMGAWVSEYSPGTSGAVTVYVRVSSQTKPVAGVPVSLWVQFPGYGHGYGTKRTGEDGLVKFTVDYHGLPAARPVVATASANIGGTQLSADTSFVPA